MGNKYRYAHLSYAGGAGEGHHQRLPSAGPPIHLPGGDGADHNPDRLVLARDMGPQPRLQRADHILNEGTRLEGPQGRGDGAVSGHGERVKSDVGGWDGFNGKIQRRENKETRAK